jgi:hypothetical protein
MSLPPSFPLKSLSPHSAHKSPETLPFTRSFATLPPDQVGKHATLCTEDPCVLHVSMCPLRVDVMAGGAAAPASAPQPATTDAQGRPAEILPPLRHRVSQELQEYYRRVQQLLFPAAAEQAAAAAAQPLGTGGPTPEVAAVLDSLATDPGGCLISFWFNVLGRIWDTLAFSTRGIHYTPSCLPFLWFLMSLNQGIKNLVVREIRRLTGRRCRCAAPRHGRAHVGSRRCAGQPRFGPRWILLLFLFIWRTWDTPALRTLKIYCRPTCLPFLWSRFFL